MMNYYISISTSHYGHDSERLNRGYLYIKNRNTGWTCFKTLSYEEGMLILRKLERRFGQLAEMTSNWYESDICNKELTGVIGP